MATKSNKKTAKKPAVKKAIKASTKKMKPASKKVAAKKSAAVKKPAVKKIAAKPAPKAKVSKAAPAPVKKPASNAKPAASSVFKTSFTPEEQKLLKISAANYMNREMLEFFKKRLLELRAETLMHIEEVRRELANEEPQADELDKAVMEEERMLKLRVIERESKLLPKIEYALRKIGSGAYGYCEETGEPIGVERLLLRPTATYSVEAKEFREQKEKEFSDEVV